MHQFIPCTVQAPWTLCMLPSRKKKKFTKFLKTVSCQAFVTVLDLITNQQLCINSTNACARTFKKKKVKKKVYVYVCTCARSCVCLKEYTCEHVRVCVYGELALSWRERASERGWEGKWKKTGSSWRPPPPLPTPRVEPHSASHLHCLAQPQSAKAIDF